MTRPRSIETGDPTAGASIEYVRTRGVFRLGGWHAGGRRIAATEVALPTFLHELGISPADCSASSAYLLLAAVQDHPSRGQRFVTEAFPSELEARQAFRALRAQHALPTDWAQVVALDPACRLTPVCWFGEVGRPESAPARPRWWGARRNKAN